MEAIEPDWAVPVRALVSTRSGGVSRGPFASLNVSSSVGDDPAAVAANRARVEQAIGAPIVWLRLVHGAAVAEVGPEHLNGERPVADAAWTMVPGVACAVTAADCLPVLFATRSGDAVAVAHAGWRGLALGVLEATVAALARGSGSASGDIVVWLGPCIGPAHYEVGADVLEAFGCPGADDARFRWRPRADGSPRWLANLPLLARERLERAGVDQIGGGHWCTASDPSRFFSFRRDRITGRHVAVIRLGR
jgi:hypothetical protein